MKDKERDIFDDLFRSKLQDFEADTMPGDWEAPGTGQARASLLLPHKSLPRRNRMFVSGQRRHSPYWRRRPSLPLSAIAIDEAASHIVPACSHR